MKNDSKTASKQNQAKPRGPRQSCGAKGWILAALGVTWGRLGRSFAPLGIALVDFLLLLGRFGSHFSILMAVGWAWKLNQDHFWRHFASTNIEKTMPKQDLFRIRKTWIFATCLQYKLDFGGGQGIKHPEKTLKINETSGLKQVK